MRVVDLLEEAKSNQKIQIISARIKGDKIADEKPIAMYCLSPCFEKARKRYLPIRASIPLSELTITEIPEITPDSFSEAILLSEVVHWESHGDIFNIEIDEEDYIVISEQFGKQSEIAKIDLLYYEYLNKSIKATKCLLDSFYDKIDKVTFEGELAFLNAQKEYREIQNEYKRFVQGMDYLL